MSAIPLVPMRREAPVAVAAVPVIPAKRVAEPVASASRPRDERFAALKKEHEEAMNAYYDLFRNAKTDEEMQEIARTVKAPDMEGFSNRARALIAEDVTDTTAYQAACWMIENRVESGAERASPIDLIAEHHSARPELGELALNLGYSEEPAAHALLERLSERSPHKDVRGMALASLAQVKKSQRETALTLRQMGPEKARADYGQYMSAERIDTLLNADPARLEADAVAIYERIQKDYADVKTMPGTPYESSLGDQAKSALFEIQNLAVGKMAPEIEGEDVDGVAFKLSDYRGKVVMLDFWGFW